MGFLAQLCRRLRRSCASDAEDLAQDVIVRFIEHSSAANAPRDVRGWIVRAARNLAADAARRESLRLPFAEEHSPSLDDHASTRDLRPDRAAQVRELHSILASTLREAPPAELAVAQLRAAGQPLRGAAAGLGLSIASAWRIEARLRMRLTRALGVDADRRADTISLRADRPLSQFS